MNETPVEKHSFDEIFSLYEISRAEQKNCKDDGDKINNLYFEPVLARIDKFLQDINKDNEDYMKLLAMKSCLYYEQGKLLLERDQIEFALETMKNALLLIQEHKVNPLITYLYYRIINYHSYYLSRTENLEEAKNILEEAEQLYYALSNKSDIVICGTDELFRKIEPKHPYNKIEKFEKLVTNNLQLQGWIYSKMGETDKFLIYHHRVLNRHLENQDCDAFTWINKCARLASHFIDLHRFSEARYHLAAACAVLRECEKDLDSIQRSVEMGHVRRAYAELGKQWVKYGLWLFEMSSRKVTVPDEAIDQLLITSFNDSDNPVSTDEQSEMPVIDTSVPETDVAAADYSETIDNYTFVFPTLFVADIESQVTDVLFSTTEEARKLFLYIQEWLKRAKSFFTLRHYPTEHVDLIFELCDLYKYLATYESDIDSQYNVQKRRSDILDTLYNMLKDVQPEDYTTSCMEVFRELTQVQIELIFFNLKRLSASSSASRTHISHQLEAVRSVHEQLGKFVKYQRSKKSAKAANNRIVTAINEQTVTETNEKIAATTNEQIVIENNEPIVTENEEIVTENNEQTVSATKKEQTVDVINEQIINVINEQTVDVINEQPVTAIGEEAITVV